MNYPGNSSTNLWVGCPHCTLQQSLPATGFCCLCAMPFFELTPPSRPTPPQPTQMGYLNTKPRSNEAQEQEMSRLTSLATVASAIPAIDTGNANGNALTPSAEDKVGAPKRGAEGPLPLPARSSVPPPLEFPPPSTQPVETDPFDAMIEELFHEDILDFGVDDHMLDPLFPPDFPLLETSPPPPPPPPPARPLKRKRDQDNRRQRETLRIQRRQRAQERRQARLRLRLRAEQPKEPPAIEVPPPPMHAGKRELPNFSNLVENARILPLLPSLDHRAMLISACFGVDESAARAWCLSLESKPGFDVGQAMLWSFIRSFAKDTNGLKGECQCDPSKAMSMLGKDRWDLLQTNLDAHERHPAFLQWLDSVGPVSGDTLEGTKVCAVCCDSYALGTFVSCTASCGQHLCLGCFHKYMTKTIQVTSLSCVPCAGWMCNAVYPVDSVKLCLSGWDQMRATDREEEINIRVALTAPAVVHCKCGCVAVFEADDGCDRVSCPGCPLEFCIKCGLEYHNGQACLTPQGTVEWVNQRTKACPNCSMPIEKDGGCDHMCCRRPMGCGHHFFYSNLQPYPRR